MPPTVVRFRGVPYTESIEREARDRAATLTAEHPGIQRCEVEVTLPHDHARHDASIRVRVLMTVGDATLEAVGTLEALDDDVQVALRDAFLAARRCMLVHDVETKSTVPIRVLTPS